MSDTTEPKQALEAVGDMDSYEFDIFISYATDPDYGLARQLESFLETFYRLPTPDNLSLRPLRVCVDGSDFKAARGDGEGAKVGSVIEHYLAKSRALLVLCSKNARRSPWVDKELRWFLTHRGHNAIMVALTEGEALNKLAEVFPQAIVEAGLHERIAYDFRGARRRARLEFQALRDYEDERTRLAATLYDRPAGEIRPIWFREQRRQARNRTRVFASITVVLLGLLAVAVYFFLNAREERKNALAEAARTRRQFYVATVNLSRRALDEGSVPLARQLLEAQRPGEGQEDLRDFDWWHLLRRTGSEKLRLSVKDVKIGTASVSPDGALVAAAGESSLAREDPSDESGPPQSIYLWSLDGGELRHVFKGHAGAVWALKFSPTTPVLVSGGEDGLKVWDAATGTEMRSLKLPPIESLAFSPDGRTVAASHGTHFTLLDATTWEVMGRLAGSPTEFAFALAFSPDGKLLATGGEDKKVHLWDVPSLKEINLLNGRARVLALAWSARTNLLAVGGADGDVTLWDMNVKAELSRLPQGDGAHALAFSPDGKLLAVGLGDPLDTESGKTVLLWDVMTRTRRGLFKGHFGRVSSLEFTPSGEAIVSAAEEDAARVWDVQTASFLAFFGGHDEPVESLAFSPDGRLMASGDSGGTIRVWTLDGSTPPVTLRENDWPVVGLAFDLAGRLVWSGKRGGLVLWEPASGTAPRKLPAPEFYWEEVQFAPDGNTLAATTCDGDIYLWGWPSFVPLWHVNQGGCLGFLAWSHDGQYLAVGGGHSEEPSPTSVFVWRVGNPYPLSVLEGHSSWPTEAAFSPDGKHLVTGSWDGEIIIWDFAASVALQTLRGHSDRVTDVIFSPSGKVVASASDDKSVRIWDVVTGQERMALYDSQQQMFTLAFHPGGKMLAAAGSFYRVGRMQPPSILKTEVKPTGMILIWAAAGSAQAVAPQR